MSLGGHRWRTWALYTKQTADGATAAYRTAISAKYQGIIIQKRLVRVASFGRTRDILAAKGRHGLTASVAPRLVLWTRLAGLVPLDASSGVCTSGRPSVEMTNRWAGKTAIVRSPDIRGIGLHPS